MKQALFGLCAVGLTTACNPLPSGTFDLNETELARVEAAIQEGKDGKPIVQALLGYSDPLFDIEGSRVENNQILAEDLDDIESDLDWYLANGHIVGFETPDVPDVADGVARLDGRLHSEQREDRWIAVNVSMIDQLDGNDMFHEGAHRAFGGHSDVMHTYLEEAGSAQTQTAAFVDVVLAEQDAPYLVSALYRTPWYLDAMGKNVSIAPDVWQDSEALFTAIGVTEDELTEVVNDL